VQKAARICFGAAVVAFLLAPLVTILPLAFTSSVFLNYPIPSFSLKWFGELITADAWRRSIANSLVIGAGTTALATSLGTLAALGLRSQ
jgi:putative spermidine/putrescine transport system permease protein